MKGESLLTGVAPKLVENNTVTSHEDKEERLSLKLTLSLFVISTTVTIASHIVEYLEQIGTPLPDFFGKYLGHSGAVFFQISVCAAVLFIVEKAPEFRHEVQNFLNQLSFRVDGLKDSVDHELPRVMRERIAQATADIGRDFAVRTTRAVRLVDPDSEYQMDTLYRGSLSIMGYYPVHSILRDNPALRGVIGTAMQDAKFKKYEMILGNTGHLNLLMAIAEWKNHANNLKRTTLNDYKVEQLRIDAFLDKTWIKWCERCDEQAHVRTSFFVVEPSESEANALRAVVYIWDKPFGFNFDTVEGAFVIEGQSSYIRALQARFKEEWSSIEARSIVARNLWDERSKSSAWIAAQTTQPTKAEEKSTRRETPWPFFGARLLHDDTPSS